MRRHPPLLGCLMLVLTPWTGTHAAEVVGCVDVSAAESWMHFDGDAL